jgi:hypothetical protein
MINMSGSINISISPLPLGYRSGMGQPSIGISITLGRPADFSLAAAQKELVEVFECGADDLPHLAMPASSQLPSNMRNFLRCAFELARKLLKDSGVPAFAQERI